MDDDEAAQGIIVLQPELPETCEFRPPIGKLDPGDLDWIGRELREYHDSVLREPVPNRLVALVDPSLARRMFL